MRRLVEPSAFHGVHGIACDRRNRLFATSVIGQSIYRVDVETGVVTTVVGPPDGVSDDIAFGPGGEMTWTGYAVGKLFSQRVDGPIRVLADGLPGMLNWHSPQFSAKSATARYCQMLRNIVARHARHIRVHSAEKATARICRGNP